MKKILLLTLITLIIGLQLSAKSLWNDDKKSQFSDRKAFQKGDIITILIEESSMASSSNSTQSGKSLEIGGESGSKDTNKTLFNSLAKMVPLFGAAAKGSSDFKKDGQDSRKSSLKATMAVVVDDIDEYGNMKLRGERHVKLNNATQKMVLTGLCRIDDVSVDNTISSTRIAEAEIIFNGDTDFSDKKKKGFFTKIANGFWNLMF